MKYPDFFIIGAPKSGSTSLFKYLSEHPNVLMSEIKGPHYFASDINDDNRIKKKRDYLKLFKKKNKDQTVIGEASVLYLCSKKAIKRIAKKLPHSKLIIILRNPIDVVQSWHAEMIWSRLEYNENFENAWIDNISDGDREKNKCIKLDYKNIFRYGEQIDRVFKYFSKKNVKIIYYEDFSSSTKKTYMEITNFLNIPNYEKNSFIKHNTYKYYKNKSLQDFLAHPPVYIIKILNYVKIKFNIKRIGLFKKILQYNTYNPKKPKISNFLKNSIIEKYNDDVNHLSKILEKDLNALWFKNKK